MPRVAVTYVSCLDGKVFRPKKELKGFTKVFLKAGESKTVTVKLDDKAFRYFNVKTDRWEVESGEYEIAVAASVSDVKLSMCIEVTAQEAPIPYENLPAYESGNVTKISEGQLEKNDAICQMYYAKSPLARFAYRVLDHMRQKAEASGKPDLNILFIFNMPFRAIGKMTGGAVSEAMVEDILTIVNGHFFRGVGKLMVNFFRNHFASKAYMNALHNREDTHESN